jgi:hypothetical protein
MFIEKKNYIYSDVFFLRDGSMRTFPSAYWFLRPLPSGAETERLAGAPAPARKKFFQPLL